MITGMGSYDSIRKSSIPAFPHTRITNIRRALRFRRSLRDPQRSVAGQLSSSVMDTTQRRILSGHIEGKGRERCVLASTNSHTARPFSTNPTIQHPTVRFRPPNRLACQDNSGQPARTPLPPKSSNRIMDRKQKGCKAGAPRLGTTHECVAVPPRVTAPGENEGRCAVHSGAYNQSRVPHRGAAWSRAARNQEKVEVERGGGGEWGSARRGGGGGYGTRWGCRRHQRNHKARGLTSG